MYNRCQKCGRKLKDPESMERGYGTECWESITKIRAVSRVPVPEEKIPGQMDIFDFPEYLPEKERK